MGSASPTTTGENVHSPSVAFGNLYQACLRKGLVARLDTFDGGQTIRVSLQTTGEEILHLSSDWGEGDLTSAAAVWLINKQLLTLADLEG